LNETAIVSRLITRIVQITKALEWKPADASQIGFNQVHYSRRKVNCWFDILDESRGEMPGKEYVLTESPALEEPAGSKDQIGWLGACRAVLLRKRLVLAFAVIGLIVGVILALITEPSFTAKAVFLPPSNPSAGASMLIGQLGQLAGISGASGGLGTIKDPGMIYVGILESRTVADDLIRQFDLQKLYRAKKLSTAEKALAKHTKFMPGKDTLITISVDDHDPRRAADMANAYLNELAMQNDRLALTEAGQRRVFFEKQLEQEKNRLADAEVELTRTEQQTGLIHPQGQAQVQIAAIAQTQAEISNREIQLSALAQRATSENPEMVRLNSELESLRDQLKRLENTNVKGNPGDPMVPTAKVPELTLEYIRKDRDVKYHEALYTLLLRQFESAKLDESRAAPLVQIVDEAVIPDQKSWPPRTIFALFFAFLGICCGIGWVVASDVWARKMSDPETAAKWQSVREAARLRGP
jgi:capsule polysaccharide export protein KpsE/RkpR